MIPPRFDGIDTEGSSEIRVLASTRGRCKRDG